MTGPLAADLPGLDLIVDPDVLASLSHDDAEWAPAGKPVGAIRARSTAEVSTVVTACAARGIPVIPRGAGT
jgi:glycolate oxidase